MCVYEHIYHFRTLRFHTLTIGGTVFCQTVLVRISAKLYPIVLRLSVLLRCSFTFCFLDEIVALKRLKMEKEKEGFPITSLREINTILKAQHENIVRVRVSIGYRTAESCLRWSDYIYSWFFYSALFFVFLPHILMIVLGS